MLYSNYNYQVSLGRMSLYVCLNNGVNSWFDQCIENWCEIGFEVPEWRRQYVGKIFGKLKCMRD